MRSLVLAVTLMAVWLLWSGHGEPLLVGFGIFSCLLVVLLSRRMGIIDEETVPVQLGLRPFVRYAPWLVSQIVVANIDVARRILSPKMPIEPALIQVKVTQQGDLGRVIYANSITLTPGTVTIDIDDGWLVVHALSADSAADLQSGEMDRRVTAVEATP